MHTNDLHPLAKRGAPMPKANITGDAHRAHHDGADLFLWRKRKAGSAKPPRGVVLLVHGSSMASTPTFDLQVKGRPEYSLMDYLAERDYDVWCVDCEGYGRSTKSRGVSCGVERGARDILAAANKILQITRIRSLHLYGISSGALRAALFAQRNPARVKRLILDAFVWTGKGSPTLRERRKRFQGVASTSRRPVNPDFIKSIFTRDHPGTAHPDVVAEYARAICALDDTIPNGTYVDMCEHLPLVDPRKIAASVMITRGQFDGIASLDDLMEFFGLLPNPDKQFVMVPGIAHASLQEKNHGIVYYLIERFFSQPSPVYEG